MFGLVDINGNPKPEYRAMEEALRMPEFTTEGFRELARQLGRDVVGDPIEDERWPDEWHSEQQTTKGFLRYSKQGNQSGFVRFTQGK